MLLATGLVVPYAACPSLVPDSLKSERMTSTQESSPNMRDSGNHRGGGWVAPRLWGFGCVWLPPRRRTSM